MTTNIGSDLVAQKKATIAGSLAAQADATVSGLATLANPSSTVGGNRILSVADLGNMHGAASIGSAFDSVNANTNQASNTANQALAVANSANGNASYVTAAYNQANAAYAQANTANATANAAMPLAGGTFTGTVNQTGTGVFKLNTTVAQQIWLSASANANTGLWTAYVDSGGTFNLQARNDNQTFPGNVNQLLYATRVNGTSNISGIYIGDTRDNAPVSITGSLAVTGAVTTGGVNILNQANAAANTVAAYANGTLVLTNANLNFNNTATITVTTAANGTTQANLSFSVNQAAGYNWTGSHTFNSRVGVGAAPTTTNYLNVQGPSGASINAEIQITDGTHQIRFHSNLTPTAWNPGVQANDHAIIFTDGTSNTGNLFIGPWSALQTGLRVDNNGNVAVNVFTANSIAVSGGIGFSQINIPQTSSELSANVTPTNKQYAPGDVRRYGADPTGVSDSSTAIKSAIQQAGQGGRAVFLPAGTYVTGSAINYTLPNSTAALSIIGEGSEVTFIKATGNTSGITINFAGQYNSIHIRDICFTTTLVNVTVGITLNQNQANVANPADTPQSDISNCTFRGADGYSIANYFASCITVNSVSNINFNGDNFVGYSTATNGFGVYLSSTLSAVGVVYNFLGCTFNYLGVGVNYGNYIQGVTFSQCNFVGDGTGIYAPSGSTGLDQLAVLDSQFNTLGSAISLSSVIPNTMIQSNLFIIGLANNTTAINFSSSGLFSIIGNCFNIGNYSSVGITGINISGTVNLYPGVISENIFDSMPVAVSLSNTSNHVIVDDSNAYRNCGSNIVNSGSNNSIGLSSNTVATFANGIIVLPAANLNFNNTATISVVAAANGTTQSNISFTVNQSAVYNWTGAQTLAGSVQRSPAISAISAGVDGGFPSIAWNYSAGTANAKIWELYSTGTDFILQALLDNVSIGNEVIHVRRTGSNLQSLVYGNSLDNPTHQFNGHVGVGGATTTNPLNVQGTAGAGITGEIQLTDGTHSLRLHSNLSPGAWNPGVQANDHGIIYTDTGANTGNLFIGPWSAYQTGMRLDNNGNVTVNVFTATTATISKVSGTVVVPGNPTTNIETRALTGLSITTASDYTIANNATIQSDANLSITINEAGTYKIDGLLAFYEAANGSGGLQFDLAGGSAAISSILWGAQGYITALVGNPAATAANTAQSYGTISTLASAPSWVDIKGLVTFSNTGSFIVRWSQVAANANGTTRKANSYVTLWKVV